MPTASTATAVNMAVQRRFAARVHQRRIAVTLAVERAADRLAARYRRLAAEAAEAAARGGIIGLDQLRRALEAEFAAAADEAAALLADAARQGFDAAARAVFDALPDEVRTLLASIAAAAVREAHNDPAAPGRWEIDSELPAGPVSDAQAAAAVRRMLFAPPSEKTVAGWLTAAIPGGLSWDQRLRRWTEPARKAMLNELTAGLAAGENVEQLRGRVQPFADNVAYKAMRIARTEGCRAAERAGRDCYERLGPMLDGMQIVAVFDEWTRPHHAARNGRIYRRGDDGAYRDERGELLPDLPDEPNCRCMTIPVLGMPEALRGNRTAQRDWRTATGKLIPDPASYLDWFAAAPRPQRVRAVGAERYQAVRDLLAAGSEPREPEWPDFIDAEGRLLPVDRLRGESEEERADRRRRFDLALAQRTELFRRVASGGTVLPGWNRFERAILHADAAQLEAEIVARVTQFRRQFALSADERRRQRAFAESEHATEEIRREVLRRERLWRDLKQTASMPPLDDLPPEYRRDAIRRLAVIKQYNDAQRMHQLRLALYVPEQQCAKIAVVGDLPGPLQYKARTAAEFWSRITDRRVLSEASIVVRVDRTLLHGGGEFRGGFVSVHPDADDKVMVHEMGHAIEILLSEWRQRARQWLDQATRRGALLEETMCKTSRGESWSYRRRTDGGPQRTFDDLYLTRVYPGSDVNEVIAQGMMMLYNEPQRVAEEDPTLFHILLGGLRR